MTRLSSDESIVDRSRGGARCIPDASCCVLGRAGRPGFGLLVLLLLHARPYICNICSSMFETSKLTRSPANAVYYCYYITPIIKQIKCISPKNGCYAILLVAASGGANWWYAVVTPRPVNDPDNFSRFARGRPPWQVAPSIATRETSTMAHFRGYAEKP